MTEILKKHLNIIIKKNKILWKGEYVIMKKFKPTIKLLCLSAVIISALSAGAVVIAKSADKNDDMEFSVNISDDNGVILDKIPIGIGVRGDSDGDGDVTIKDAALIARNVARKNISQFSKTLNGAMGDANKDGSLDIRDAAYIARYIASRKNPEKW